MHSSEAAPEAITAWRRPVSQVVAVELTDIECRWVSTYSDREGEWQWHSGARIAFSDGSTVDLLPFGPGRSDEDDERVQLLLDLLRGTVRDSGDP